MPKLNLNQLETLEPHSLGTSAWFEVSQEMITTFANVTNDHQWIHLDSERCVTESPYGTTIAHGFLTLSLLSQFSNELKLFPEGTTVINYGLDKLRFLSAVKSGSYIRNNADFISAEKRKQGILVKLKNTVEIKDESTAALIAESLLLVLPKP